MGSGDGFIEVPPSTVDLNLEGTGSEVGHVTGRTFVGELIGEGGKELVEGSGEMDAGVFGIGYAKDLLAAFEVGKEHLEVFGLTPVFAPRLNVVAVGEFAVETTFDVGGGTESVFVGGGDGEAGSARHRDLSKGEHERFVAEVVDATTEFDDGNGEQVE